jgi:beta-mannosidase
MITPFHMPLSRTSIALDLHEGWEMATAPATNGSVLPNNLQFVPASLPGTAASVLRERGQWRMGDKTRFDTFRYWFRCRFNASPVEPHEKMFLRMGGIATLAEVTLNGAEIVRTNSMFADHEADVSGLVREHNELVIACRPLALALRERRGQKPQLRWRTRVVGEQQLRWFRTTLLGRAPGFSPEPEPVGPWRPIALVRHRKVIPDFWRRQAELDGSDGVIRVDLRLKTIQNNAKPVSGQVSAGGVSAPLQFKQIGESLHEARGVLRIPNVARWWPHTHGKPELYRLRVDLQLADASETAWEDVPVGFRSIDGGPDPAGKSGLAFKINGTFVFCRGVIWTPVNVVSLCSGDEVRNRLRLLRDAGFNLIRLAGTTVYETETFHRICDELGLLVWQDMMFANMDYPFEDPGFQQLVRDEAEAELSRLARHTSTAMICGNSEIEQQVGMLGLDASLGRGQFFGEQLPRMAAEYCSGVPYIPSAPCGGDQPFRTNAGVANYFGVGAYLRPLEDARRAEVRFASECLAFSNVPEPEMVEAMARATSEGISATHPARKRGVQRDSGADWDFEDVRDHYLKLLYSVDPTGLRSADFDRYLELSRMVSGEVMAEVFGEWRRPVSTCGGGIILWGADLEPGAGWGILDARGTPKAAYWFLKRALAPCAIWTTDEGLNGIDIHISNDGPEPIDVRLRAALYHSGQRRIAESCTAARIGAHTTQTYGLERILGRFQDVSYAYRFGPPGHDIVAISVYGGYDETPFAQCFRFVGDRTAQRAPISEFDFTGQFQMLAEGKVELLLTASRFAWGVRVASLGFLPDDAYFGMEPGCKRRLVLTPTHSAQIPENGIVTALNADGSVHVPNLRRP